MSNTKQDTEEIRLTIDGNEAKVPKGTTVYTAAKQLGIDIPIFCYQDRMPPFGACRMCLVEVEKMGKLQASCILEATQGMVVNTQSQRACTGRKEIVELLLINHPLDCPICDRGGECPLQEHALAHGPGESRFFEDKRHFKKPISLGPTLTLDRERCIICARCTRFGDLIAGDHALEFIDRGYKTEVGTPDGKPVASKFIGNTIMICPVGALTSRVYRFRARPWDNDPTNSVCTLCPVGCNLIYDARDGEIMRTRSRENRDVNDIWLCDKGWFGYEYTAHQHRLKKPLIRSGGQLQETSWEEALSFMAMNIEKAKPKGKIAGLGGNSLTVEENYLFQQFMRKAIGVPHVDHRVGMPIFSYDEERCGPGMEISIGDCEKLSYVILLGVDLTEEFPIIWLRLKQAINREAKVIFAGYFSPEISSNLSRVILHSPGKEKEILHQLLPDIEALSQKGQGALFIGRQYLAHSQRSEILSEIFHLYRNVPNLSLNLLEGTCNSLGARFAGMHPEIEPLEQKAQHPGLNTLQILEETMKNGWDYLHIAGANPAKKFPSSLWQKVRSRLQCLVVQDLFLTETASQADVVLPVLSNVEKGGTFLNIEGRMQKLFPGKEIPNGIYSDGEIFLSLAKKLHYELQFDSQFSQTLESGHWPRKPIRKSQNSSPSQNSSSLTATFAKALFDDGERMQRNDHLSRLVAKRTIRIHPEEGKKRNLTHGEQVQVIANGNSITAPLTLDAKVAQGTAVIPIGFLHIPTQELGINLLNGMAIEVQKH